MYCTYLTLYSGNVLPPFYIGYTKIQKIQEGYHGTVTSQKYKSIWLKELKENLNLFKTIILTSHNTREEAKEKETYFQKSFNVNVNPMYINQHISGEKFIGPKKHSEKTKQKISKAGRNKCMSLETRKKLSEIHKGTHHSKETIEKLREIRLGFKHTEEAKKKVGIFNRGKMLSDETKKKIGDAHRGKSISNEMRQKLSIAHSGKTLSEEHKFKIGRACKGKHHSKESVRKNADKHKKPITDSVFIYSSLTEAAQLLNCSIRTISYRLKNKENWMYLAEKI